MGKIHDALQRAEDERAALRGVDAPAPPQELNPEVAPPRAPARRAQRRRQLMDGRRSGVIMQNLTSRVTEEFRSLRARIQSMRRNH